MISCPSAAASPAWRPRFPFGIARRRVLIIAPNLTIKDELLKALDITNKQKCFWRRMRVPGRIRSRRISSFFSRSEADEGPPAKSDRRLARLQQRDPAVTHLVDHNLLLEQVLELLRRVGGEELSPDVVFPFRCGSDGRAGDAVGVEMVPEVSESPGSHAARTASLVHPRITATWRSDGCGLPFCQRGPDVIAVGRSRESK